MSEEVVYVVLQREYDAESEIWWTLHSIFKDKQKAEEYAQEKSKRCWGYDRRDPTYRCEEWSVE